MVELAVGAAALEVAWYDASGAASASRPPRQARGDGPSLGLLHEGLGCVSTWRDYPSALARATGVELLAWSRAGYGRSTPVALPRPLDYMEREGTEVLPALLDAAGLERVVLVGHSDGASIALVAAAHLGPSRVAGLALLAPHVVCEELTLRSISAARDEYLQGGLRARLERHHGANTEVAFWGWNRAWLDPGFVAFDLTGYLPRISVPVVVVQGDADPYGTLRQAELICGGVAGPATCVVLPGVGHAPHRERPEETTRAVVELVAQAR